MQRRILRHAQLHSHRQPPAFSALPEHQQISSLEGTPWREAWLLTFDMGDEVVSERGVGAGVMERGAAAAGARGCHALCAQSQQLCTSGEAGDSTERRQRKAIRDRQGRRLRRKEKKKGIEQLGFWKERRRKKQNG